MRRSLNKYHKITNLNILVVIKINKNLLFLFEVITIKKGIKKTASLCDFNNWGYVNETITEIRFNRK